MGEKTFNMTMIKHDWTLLEREAVHNLPLPESMVRRSAGLLQLSDEALSLCFLAGLNSIFTGEKLLTTPNPETNRDAELLNKLGIKLSTSGAH